MKAVVYKKPQTIVVEDVPILQPDADQVLVNVMACGVCGSDIRYYYGENPWALHTLGRAEANRSDMILGHEFAGVVSAAGGAAGSGIIGKRVIAIAYNTCGVCELCITGRYHLCRETRHIGHGAGWGDIAYTPGGMAEFCPVWRTHALELPDSVSFEDAVLLDPLSVAVHAVRLSGVKPMDTCLVLGAGAVGQCIIQTARAFGARRVCCADISETALRIAETIGVDMAIDSSGGDVAEIIKRATNGKGVDFVFDTVGLADARLRPFTTLSPGGCWVNLVAADDTAVYSQMDLSSERRIMCSANSQYDDYLIGIKLMESGKFNAKPLITHRFGIDDAQKAFDVMMDKERHGAMKVVILPNS